MSFSGYVPGVFEWFAGLERDNSKAYFTSTRDVYETSVRGELEAMLEELVPEFGEHARVFRQQRDLRFSPDKSPYKLRTYGVISGGAGQGFYAELSARGLYAGTGYYAMARDQLARYRDAVASDASGPSLVAAAGAAEAAGLELEGERLRTAPRGFPRDHPRIGLLRHKGLIAGARLAIDGGGGIGRDAALGHVAGTWRAAAPLNAWLDSHVGPSAEPPDDRFGRRPR